jgi:hypothetical protein
MNDLMQKLALSKKIMEVQDRIPRGQAQGGLPVSDEMPVANYNIPQEMMGESSTPVQQMSNPRPASSDMIKSSKLPDEIKQLMMEHPIVQPSFGGGGAVLSDEIVEGAARLMGRSKPQQTQTQTQTQSQGQNMFETTELKQMIRDVVRDTVRDVVKEELRNAGMISEGKKVNDTLQLRVGSHIFEGKVTKIKKVQ